MRMIVIFFAVYFAVIECTLCEENGIHEKIQAEKIPDGYVFIDASVAEYFHPYRNAAVRWPTVSQIAESRTGINEKAAKEAVDSTMEWLKRILRTEWVPERSSLDFFPMRAYIQKKYDAVYCRYKIKNYAFQIISTHGSIIVIIKEINKKQPPDNLDLDNARAYVSEAFDMFMQKSDKIKNASMTKIVKVKNGIKGDPDNRSLQNRWWELFDWWTDGNTIMLLTTKLDERPYVPAGGQAWFSELPAKD